MRTYYTGQGKYVDKINISLKQLMRRRFCKWAVCAWEACHLRGSCQMVGDHRRDQSHSSRMRLLFGTKPTISFYGWSLLPVLGLFFVPNERSQDQ